MLVNQTRAECGPRKTAEARTVICDAVGGAAGCYVPVCVHVSVCACVYVCACVQVQHLSIARSISVPSPTQQYSLGDHRSSLGELLLPFNRQFIGAHYRSLGPLVRRGGQRAAEGIDPETSLGQERHWAW